MSRKYKCIYCDYKNERNKLYMHILKHHEDMLNEDRGVTANRIVFDICNNKTPAGSGIGSCRICHSETKWNEKKVRYEAFCSDKCKAKAREVALSNHIKVHKVPTLLTDMKWQEEKMLGNRSLTGSYRWSDGTHKKYVGSYELKFLEFCDKVGIDSSELLTPGPTIEYTYQGKKRYWITDAIYLPYNLVFDIKDGGSNKNTKDMPDTRAKQIEKETMITNDGVYNYIRLTDNDFLQLLQIFAELKESYMENDNKTKIVRIHENINSKYLLYTIKDNLLGGIVYGLSNEYCPTKIAYVKEDNTIGLSDELYKDDRYSLETMNVINKPIEEMARITKDIKATMDKGDIVKNNYILESVIGESILIESTTIYKEIFSEIKFEKINDFFTGFNETLRANIDDCGSFKFKILNENHNEILNNILTESGIEDPVSFYQNCEGGYFAYNENTKLRSRSVSDISLLNEDLILSVSCVF